MHALTAFVRLCVGVYKHDMYTCTGLVNRKRKKKPTGGAQPKKKATRNQGHNPTVVGGDSGGKGKGKGKKR